MKNNIIKEDIFSEFIHDNMVKNKTIYSKAPWHYLSLIFIKAVHNFHIYKYPEGNKEYFFKLLNMDFFLNEFIKLDENKDKVIIEQVLTSFNVCDLKIFKKYNFIQIKNKEYNKRYYDITSEIWFSMSMEYTDVFKNI